MKKKVKILLIILMPIIVISNIPPFSYVFTMILDERYSRYSNNSGSFTMAEFPFKNRDYKLAQRIFASMKEDSSINLSTSDTTLYRVFKINPLRFWLWRDFFISPRYKLPYKNWNEIKKRRGENWKRNSSYQDF